MFCRLGSFHSLQTGKPIQRNKGMFFDDRRVGNKFPFPSNGKAYPKLKIIRALHASLKRSFHSLQTGKPIQSQSLVFDDRTSVVNWVSIPFKRESASQDCENNFVNDETLKLLKFPFPSNGKVHRKSENGCRRQWGADVSIPFKRESASQANVRVYLKLGPNAIKHSADFEFPFPSNGKVYLKLRI